jgi:hypothetical protein
MMDDLSGLLQAFFSKQREKSGQSVEHQELLKSDFRKRSLIEGGIRTSKRK